MSGDIAPTTFKLAEYKKHLQSVVLKTEPRNLSWWSTQTFRGCPRKFQWMCQERRKVDPLRTYPETVASNAAHATIEHLVKHPEEDRSKWEGVVRQKFETMIAKTPVRWRGTGQLERVMVLDKARSATLYILNHLDREGIWKDGRELYAEYAMNNVLVLEDPPTSWTSRVDMVAVRLNDSAQNGDSVGKVKAFEWKGTRTAQIPVSGQVGFYSLSLELDGLEVEEVHIVFSRLRLVHKLPRPKDEEIGAFLGDLKNTVAEIERAEQAGFPPTPSPNACRFCPFGYSTNPNTRCKEGAAVVQREGYEP